MTGSISNFEELSTALIASNALALSAFIIIPTFQQSLHLPCPPRAGCGHAKAPARSTPRPRADPEAAELWSGQGSSDRTSTSNGGIGTRVRGGRGRGTWRGEVRPRAVGASSWGRHGQGGPEATRVMPGHGWSRLSLKATGEAEAGKSAGPRLAGEYAGAGDSARGKGAVREEDASRHGALAPTSKGQGRKRRLPDIKVRAGDWEGGGAPKVSPAGTVGKAGSAERRAWVHAGARGREAVALKVVGQLRPSWGGIRGHLRKVAVGHFHGQAGGRVWGPGQGAAGPLPRLGEQPGLSYSAFSWKRPWRQNGWWRRPGPTAPPVAAALRAPTQPRRPEGGSRRQVTAAQAVGPAPTRGQRRRSRALTAGLGWRLGCSPPPPHPRGIQLGSPPAWGAVWAMQAASPPSPPPPPRMMGGECWVWAEPAVAECTFIASCLSQRSFLSVPPGPRDLLQCLLCLIFSFRFLFFPFSLQQH